MLTRTQKQILAAGVACVALCALWVPWRHELHTRLVDQEWSAGYSFIGNPPARDTSNELSREYTGVKIDLPRIAIEVVAVVLVTAAAFVLAGQLGGRTNSARR